MGRKVHPPPPCQLTYRWVLLQQLPPRAGISEREPGKIASGSTPFRSNIKDNGLRVKVDPLTQFFDEQKKSVFPAIEEGTLKGDILSCIVEVSGIYFFQDVYGLTVRAHQVVIRKRTSSAAAESKCDVTDGDALKGFAFI